MRNFWILFKYELKMQFPLRPQKGRRIDILGAVLSVLMVTLISAVIVQLLSSVAATYSTIRVKRVYNPLMRTKELLNVCYMAVIAVLSIASLINMRRSLTDKRYKELFLRIPVKPQTIFISKLLTLLISNYILAFMLLGAVSLIFYLSVSLPASFWTMTCLVWLLMPLAAFLIATVLLVPFIKVMEFISQRYVVMFVSVSALVMVAFLLYSSFLDTVQNLLNTGTIKMLFNADFIATMQYLLEYAYPSNCYADLVLSTDYFSHSLSVVLIIAGVALVAAYVVSKILFYATLYKNENRSHTYKPTEQKYQFSPLVSLMKKEFICIFREPKHLFAYFSIAASMPLMVYCCYTLFESLIYNMIGLEIEFPLAVIVVLIFSILTNTFCSNNITREGAAAIKVKTFPIPPTLIMLSKVLFCAIISSLSIVVSLLVLAIATPLTFGDALLIMIIGIAFSTAQIFVATRMDLNGAKLSSTIQEMKNASNRTIAKVVALGLVLALVAGVLSLVAYVFSLGSSVSFIAKLGLKEIHAYLIPVLVSFGYLGVAIAYYSIRIKKSLEGLSI